MYTSAVLLQRPDHRLFKALDWDRVESGEYAIVDPLDPNAILYLPERDYIIQTRVSQTQGNKPVILATPRDKRPASVSVNTPGASTEVSEKSDSQVDATKGIDSKSENTPALDTSPSTTQIQNSPTFTDKKDIKWRLSRLFKNPFHFVKRVQTRAVHGMVIENQVVVELETLVPLFRVWAYYLHRRIVGLSSDRTLQNNVLIFVRKLYHSYRHHGINALNTRLKVMLFCVNSFIAGNPLKTTNDLGFRIRLSHGLPTLLPLPVRQSIRNRTKTTIVIWASLLYTYRAFAGKHKKPDLASIAQPFIVTDEYKEELSKFEDFCLIFTKWVFRLAKIDLGWVWENLLPKEITFSASAGPNAGWTFLSAPLDTIYWLLMGFEQSSLYRYMRAVNADTSQFFFISTKIVEKLIGPTLFMSPEDIDQTSLDKVRDALERGKDFDGNKLPSHFLPPRGDNRSIKELYCGRLHALKEAAGKVRIIAIVDIWTQTLLRPLHDVFFKILKALPTDATFDQQAGVNSFAKEGHKEIFSYDLKAATDTIPWVLYRVVMTGLLGEVITDAWLALLRERDWLTPSWDEVSYDKRRKKEVTKSRRISYLGKHTVRYGTGQPMGAYSSWGALAVLHHGVVQYSAFLVGAFPFTGYRVLGDDIVIAGKAVAESYRLVCSRLGIVIGLPKSFTSSEGFFNFASQSFLGEQNLSPFSLADELATDSAKSRFNAVYSAMGRGYLDPEADNFFARTLRFALTPSLTKRVELARRSGVVHNAVHYVAGLVFGALLSGSKAFGENLQGLTGIEISSGLVSPGLPLFSMSLLRFAQSSVRDVGDSYFGLRTYQGLILAEYKSTLNKLEARIRTLQSMVSTPFVSPLALLHTNVTKVRRMQVDMRERYQKALDGLRWYPTIEFSSDTVLTPNAEVDGLSELHEIPRWTLNYKASPRILLPDSVKLGDREHHLDGFCSIFLGNAHNRMQILEKVISEVSTLSSTLVAFRTCLGIYEQDPEKVITNELRWVLAQPPFQDLDEEARAKELADRREVRIREYREMLDLHKEAILEIRKSLEQSQLSIFLPSTPSETVRDFDRSLISILDLVLKSKKQEASGGVFAYT